MYEVTHEGESVTLNDRDYEQLLKRFDPAGFKRVHLGYENLAPCICKWYKCCIGCPLQEGRIGQAHCMNLVYRIAGGTIGITLTYDAVYANERELPKIQKVYDVLAAAKKL